jgi:hypothetical protein
MMHEELLLNALYLIIYDHVAVMRSSKEKNFSSFTYTETFVREITE